MPIFRARLEKNPPLSEEFDAGAVATRTVGFAASVVAGAEVERKSPPELAGDASASVGSSAERGGLTVGGTDGTAA